MPKVFYKEINYKYLFLITLKEKFLSFIIGLIFFISLSYYSFSLYTNFINFKFSKHLIKNKINTNKKVIDDKKNYYLVQPNDDLWRISEKFYGNGEFVNKIAEENNLDVNQPIEPGQRLIIPKIENLKNNQGEISSLTTNRKTDNLSYYIVAPGDSLSLISLKVYGNLFDWPKILNANNLTNPDQIEVGMKLLIPN